MLGKNKKPKPSGFGKTMSDALKGRIHKPDCQCACCTNKRGEFIKRNHKSDCLCASCRVKRGDYFLPFIGINKSEVKLQEIIDKLFPNEYKYVGDQQFVLDGRCPDFVNINGQKKIIELFGDYWHGEERTGVSNERHEQERVERFAQFGFQTLVIWEHELKDVDLIVEKIVNFHNI